MSGAADSSSARPQEPSWQSVQQQGGLNPEHTLNANNSSMNFMEGLKAHLTSTGQLDFYHKAMPPIEKLHIENTPKNTNPAIAPRRLFLGEGPDWTIWAYIRTYPTARSAVDLMKELKDAEGKASGLVKLMNADGFPLIYPFQTFNVNTVNERGRNILIMMKILIKIVFYQDGAQGRIFHNPGFTFESVSELLKYMERDYKHKGFLTHTPPVYGPGSQKPASAD